MSREKDMEKLAEIRVMIEALPAEFSIGADAGEDLCLFAPAIEGPGHETVARLERGIAFQIQRAIQFAPENYRFLLGLLDQAISAYRDVRKRLEHYEPPPRPERKAKDYAAEAAMKCGHAAFRRYLIECHDLPADADADRIAVRLRTLLRVKSRGELNTDPAALARWKKLKEDFEIWLKH